MINKIAIIALSLSGIFISNTVLANHDPEDDMWQGNADSQSIPATFSEFEGENIDLRTRQLIYQHTDLVLPGNGGLDIVVSRSHNRVIMPIYGQPDSLGNWQLDVPMIWGNKFRGCDSPTPITASLKGVRWVNEGWPIYWTKYFTFDQNWQARDYMGLTLSIPGQPNRELLFKYVGGVLQNGQNGAGIEYITVDNWKATCYQPPGGTTKSAFLVTAPDGTKYYFEKAAGSTQTSTWWEDSQANCRFYCVANVPRPTCSQNNPVPTCDEFDSQDRNDLGEGLYGRFRDNLWDPTFFKASKVEDISGNSISYFYNESSSGVQSPNGQLHLTRIEGSDGRNVTFGYDYYPNFWMSKHVNLLKTVTTNDGRTVTYNYNWNANETATTPVLWHAFLPENRYWEFTYETGDDFVERFTHGIRIKSVQNPNFAKVTYNYVSTSSDFYGGISGRRKIYGNVHERIVENSYYDQFDLTSYSWEIGTWTFESTRETTTEAINRTKITYPPVIDPISWTDNFSFTKTYDFVRNRGSWRHGLLIRSEVDDPNFAPSQQRETTFEWQQRTEVGENNAKERLVSIKYQRALTRKTVSQDGTQFVTVYGDFDQYNHPRYINETGNTVRGTQYSRQKYLTYYNNTSLNIIGFPKDEEIVGLGPTAKKYESYIPGKCLPSFPIPICSDPIGVNLLAISGDGAITRVYNSTFSQNADGTENPIGKLRSITQYGVKTEFSYDQNGNIATIKDANSKVTRFEDYHRGVPESITTPENTISRNVLDRGVVEWEKNGRNFTTRFEYDGLNRLDSIDRPINNLEDIVNLTYSTVSNRGGRTAIQFHNGLGQKTVHKDWGTTGTSALRGSATYYDSVGRVDFHSFTQDGWTAAKEWDGKYTNYDALDRVTYVHTWDEDTSKDENTTMYFEYVSDGVLVTDQKGNETKLFYASFGNPGERFLVGALLPPDEQGVRAEYEIERDDAGKVKRITELRSGIERRYEYNTKQQLWKEINPETGTTEFQYDNAGNRNRKTIAFGTANAKSTIYGYDGLNRIKSIDYPSPTPDIAMIYDGAGNLDSIDNSIAFWDYIYDANNNLTDEYLLIDGLRFRINYTYDGNDHMSLMKYPSGKIIDYAPDPRGIPTQAAPYINLASYYATGQVKNLEYANGQVVTQLITPQKRLESIEMLRNGQQIKDIDLTYGYDLNRNIDSITDSANPAFSRVLGYDNLNRLTSATGNWGTGSISYDTIGNIKTKNIGGTNLTYNYNATTNLLETVTGTENYVLGYDDYGNVTATKGQKTFFYDDASNLRNASISASTLYNYAYDGNNRLVRTVKDGNTIYSAYNKAGRKVMEYSPAGDWVKETFYIGSTIIADRKLTALSSTDSDGDGILDKVELENGLSLEDPADRNSDIDGDGLSAFAELQAGTDLYNSDSDGDGLSDGDEVNTYHTNPLSTDTDGDGVADNDEIIAGTDPNVNIPAIMSIINNLLLSD